MLAPVTAVCIKTGGYDPAGCHAVDPNAVTAPFNRSRHCEILHATSGCSRMPHGGQGHPMVGCYINDHARALFLHALAKDFPAHKETAGQISADHRVPTILANIFQASRKLAAGIVYQSLDRSVPVDDHFHSGNDIRFLTNV